MNEDRILKAVRSATSHEVSERVDAAVLKAAREKAAALDAAGGRAVSLRRRIIRIAAVAAMLALACGATLFAERMGWLAPMSGFFGLSYSPQGSRETPVKTGEAGGAIAPSGGEVGGSAPPNDEPYSSVYFRRYDDNPFIDTDDCRVSAFALDIDTGSYTIMRRYMRDANIPPAKAVRTEEFLNYFFYRYAPPADGALAVHAEGAPTPFGENENYRLLRIGVRAKDVAPEKRKDANIVLAVDVSASMGIDDRIGLVRKSLRLLLDALREGDTVAVVAFGSRAAVALEPTPVKDIDAVIRAVESLVPEGGADVTDIEAGLILAYGVAGKIFDKGKTNRVILCSDGVANRGATGPLSILATLRETGRKGIYLTAAGFGMGNYNDFLMEQLADRADGNYFYIDNIEQAKRVFVENLVGTIQVVAKDVRLRVEFNPEMVTRFRLLGYENRSAGDESGTGAEGGEIGAGQSVTALYEIKMQKDAPAGRIASLKLSYTDADTGKESAIEKETGAGDIGAAFENASADFRLAAGAAEFAEILRKSYWARKSAFADVLPVIQGVLKDRPDDADIVELYALVAKAMKISQKDE